MDSITVDGITLTTTQVIQNLATFAQMGQWAGGGLQLTEEQQRAFENKAEELGYCQRIAFSRVFRLTTSGIALYRQSR